MLAASEIERDLPVPANRYDQLLVLDVYLPRTRKGLCSFAAVSGWRGLLASSLLSGASFRAIRLIEHRACLLRIARPDQQRRHRMQCIFELAVIGLAQRRLARIVQHPVQLRQVHIDAAPGLLHATPPRSSRKRFVNGYPRTSLIDRFGT